MGQVTLRGRELQIAERRGFRNGVMGGTRAKGCKKRRTQEAI